ncbi:MAG: hypothetical protein M1817_005319 [Caeruleum heppii]|nr:MAG: hypothetical protein M1817_005319 [Caeruleum heppii]
METAVALGLTGLLAYYSWSRQKLTPMGIIAAVLTGLVHAIHPWKAFYAFLIVFFIGGTAVTKVKHDVKTRLTLSSAGSAGGEGPRTHVQVLANSIIATALILLHLTQLGYFSQGTASLSDCWRKRDGLVVAGITINYAAVAADTFSSELGILSRSAPRLITSPAFRRVPAGTNGGVTLLGTLAGFLGSFTIAITSLVFLPFCKTTASEAQGSWTLRDKILWAVFVIVWGAAGSLLDSLLGGLFQASVVDVRTGKVVEGVGGKKVDFHMLIAHPSLNFYHRSSPATVETVS